MEKLKTGIMLYALREILNHPSQLLEDNVNQKIFKNLFIN